MNGPQEFVKHVPLELVPILPEFPLIDAERIINIYNGLVEGRDELPDVERRVLRATALRALQEEQERVPRIWESFGRRTTR